jgi:hypothetical protein
MTIILDIVSSAATTFTCVDGKVVLTGYVLWKSELCADGFLEFVDWRNV